MVKISQDEIATLLEALQSFVGYNVVVGETISRSRTDQHLAPRSRFTLSVQEFVHTLSGLLLSLESDNQDQYCMAGDDIASVILEDGTLTIKEHYEEKTLRQTVIRRAA